LGPLKEETTSKGKNLKLKNSEEETLFIREAGLGGG